MAYGQRYDNIVALKAPVRVSINGNFSRVSHESHLTDKNCNSEVKPGVLYTSPIIIYLMTEENSGMSNLGDHLKGVQSWEV